MKFTLFIDGEKEEQVIVYAHKKTPIVASIEQLVSEENMELLGYSETQVTRLSVADVYCFIVESNKIYAITEKKKLNIKSRLYRLEEKLPEGFVKINQSCIANIKKVERFDASISGTLKVIFKNGYADYVSRRNVKKVKERLGY